MSGSSRVVGGEDGGDGVGGVAGQVAPGAVIALSGAGVAVAQGVLDVAQWDAGVEGDGREGVSHGVWACRGPVLLGVARLQLEAWRTDAGDGSKSYGMRLE